MRDESGVYRERLLTVDEGARCFSYEIYESPLPTVRARDRVRLRVRPTQWAARGP